MSQAAFARLAAILKLGRAAQIRVDRSATERARRFARQVTCRPERRLASRLSERSIGGVE
jgi:hypothetical protein